MYEPPKAPSRQNQQPSQPANSGSFIFSLTPMIVAGTLIGAEIAAIYLVFRNFDPVWGFCLLAFFIHLLLFSIAVGHITSDMDKLRDGLVAASNGLLTLFGLFGKNPSSSPNKD